MSVKPGVRKVVCLRFGGASPRVLLELDVDEEGVVVGVVVRSW